MGEGVRVRMGNKGVGEGVRVRLRYPSLILTYHNPNNPTNPGGNSTPNANANTILTYTQNITRNLTLTLTLNLILTISPDPNRGIRESL